MKKVLITGAGGYIGSIATSLFLEAGYTIVSVDSYLRGYKAPLLYLQNTYGEDQLRCHTADIRDTEALVKIFHEERDIQAVLHYAALCDVGESEKEPGLYFNNNVQGAVGLMEAMRIVGVRKIVFSSTCAVYGEPQTDTLDETHPVNPKAHPYGESKYMSERVIDWYAQYFGLTYLFLRYFNVCGAADNGELGDSKDPSSALMQNAVRGALGISDFYLNYTHVNTPDGSPIRDYVNVVDLNRAHVKAVEYVLTTDSSDIFNLGTGTGHSVLEIVNMVQKVTGKTFELKETDRRKGDVSKAVASNAKITRVLGWQPEHTLEDSVTSLVRWYTKHPRGWKTEEAQGS